jgi:hypothetical protein
VSRAPCSLLGFLPLSDASIYAFERGYAFCVELNEARPFTRHISVMKNRLDGTLRDASFAIDARFRINVKLHFILVKTITWANDDAIRVFAIVTRLAHNIGHR